MHRFFNQAFFITGMKIIISFKNLHACGYQIPQSVEIECILYPYTTLDKNRSAINIFRSLDISTARIPLCFGSIITQSQINSDIFYCSFNNKYTLIFLLCENFFDLNFESNSDEDMNFLY